MPQPPLSKVMTPPVTLSFSPAPRGLIFPVLALALGLFPLGVLPLRAQDLAAPPLEPAPAEPAVAEPAAAEPAQEGFAPTEHPKDRYEKMAIRSPFDFELAKPPTEAAVNPFADFVLAGFAGSASRPTVYLTNSKTQERVTILSEGNGRKNENGFKIIKIDRGRTLSSTTATIEKDGVQEVLKFDTKILYTMTGGAGGGGGAPAQVGRSPIPGQPGVPGQVPRPVGPGQPARPVQAYVAPQAFIPNSGGGGGGRNMQQQGGGAQPALSVPANPGPGANAAQASLNVLLANSTNGQIQPTVVPAQPAVPVPNQANPPQPNRRRVVLPSQ